MRIEDLDQVRTRAAGGIANQQLADLQALGIDWDGDPIWQSNDLDRYRLAASGLESYECFCSRKDILEASTAPHDGYRPYPGTCANLSEAERAKKRLTRNPAIRVRAGGVKYSITDLHAGLVSAVVDDFVLFRADGTPSYNLASVVDDCLCGVDQVVRADDLLSSAVRQAWLANQLGYQQPNYIHVSLAINHDGKRLAKRAGDYSMRDLDFTPARIIQILAASCGLPQEPSPRKILEAISDTTWWRSPKIWQPWIVDAADF